MLTRRDWLRTAVAGVAAASRLVAAPRTLYVAPDGRDNWSGTRADSTSTDGPLATLAAARDALRGGPAGARKQIVVRGGEYFLPAPLTLDHRDAGLSIEAAPGEEAVLYGGRRVTGWAPGGGGLWAARVDPGWDFRMLMVNQRYCPRARLPETGTFTHLSEFPVRWMSTTGGGWERKPTGEELTTMRFQPADLGEWLDPENAEIRLYHMWDESLLPVRSVDHAQGILRFASPSGHPAGAFNVRKYVVWNIREGMRSPGQWYLDRRARKVVYWPLPGEDMEEAEVIAPVLESVVRIEGTEASPVRDVALRGLAVSATNTPAGAGGFGAARYDGAVALNHASNCELRDLQLVNVGGQGVKANGCGGLRVERCHVFSCGAGGLRIGGNQFTVSDNRIHHIGLTYPSAIALSGRGNGGSIEHNDIHHTPYSAINSGGEDISIAGNHLHHAMLELHDGAAIYVTFCKRISLTGNHAHDIPDTGGYGSSSYYLDEQAEDCRVEGNLSDNVGRPSHNHMARRNTISGNVFLSDGDMRMTFQKSEDFRLERNVLAAGGKITVVNGQSVTESGANIAWSGARVFEGLPENTLIANPGVERTGPGRVRFAAGSAAGELGIEPLDVSRAGCRREP